MKIAVVSIFYNTKRLLNPLYRSFKKQSNINEYDFYVYDNSDDEDKKVSTAEDGVIIRHIDSKSLIGDIPAYNGSAKHTKSIDIALNELKMKYDVCILLDSDIIITKSITPYLEEFIAGEYTLCGFHDITSNRNLIHPCAMIINLNDYRKYNLHFYDKMRMYGVKPTKNTYDTGMSFYEDVIKKNLKVLEIPYNSYFNHFGGGSRDYKTCGKVKTNDRIYRNLDEWLDDFKSFYE